MDESISEKTIAEFFGWCLTHGLDYRRFIIQWADRLIAQSSAPEHWMIELSICGDTVEGTLARLREVPGTVRRSSVQALRIGLLQRQWPKDEITLAHCLYVLTELAGEAIHPDSEDHILEPKHQEMLLSIVYDHAEWDTQENVTRMIDAFLQECPDYSMLIEELFA
jgi:hypothetical protein